jgi:hypothetical protein
VGGEFEQGTESITPVGKQIAKGQAVRTTKWAVVRDVVGCYKTRNTESWFSRNLTKAEIPVVLQVYENADRMQERVKWRTRVDMVMYFWIVQNCGTECHSSVDGSTAAYSADAQLTCPKFVAVLNLSKRRCQWWIVTRRTGLADRDTMRYGNVPLDLTSGSEFAIGICYISCVFTHTLAHFFQPIIYLSPAISCPV